MQVKKRTYERAVDRFTRLFARQAGVRKHGTGTSGMFDNFYAYFWFDKYLCLRSEELHLGVRGLMHV
jgi:hypothetical protein